MSPKIYTSTSPAKILLVDDHPMLRRGMADLLSLEPDFDVVADVGSGEEALSYLQDNDVDLIILDQNMPGLSGLDTLKRIHEQDFKTKILMFTVSDSGDDIHSALKLGVNGYLLKDMQPEQVAMDIRKALRGELVVSSRLAAVLAQALRTPNLDDIVTNLTGRELEVVKMIAKGHSNKMIGNELGISESTVKVHVKHILNKTNLRTRVDVAVWAVNNLSS
ncbi:two-component system response regulator NarL [Psychrobacter sp. FDAARGOS_221]|uniref:two-component system response regulator NarL n=1 Tax=Psychrobacter sp. FDAARGOS_221 TaxID=1975705 RepID=UPI000BB53D7C|nr:two-component system response regulator NarL [Psychrobacter sp. FDAARGOS_221]PNK60088.1 two-component system response regulator NarL [Psychrobacter sp. FDAARGOS_221]